LSPSKEAYCLLHSKFRVMTPTIEIDLIARRLKTAQADDRARRREERPLPSQAIPGRI